MKIFFWIYFWRKYFSPRSSLRSPTEMITDRGTDLILSFVSNIRLVWIIVIVITDELQRIDTVLFCITPANDRLLLVRGCLEGSKLPAGLEPVHHLADQLVNTRLLGPALDTGHTTR